MNFRKNLQDRQAGFQMAPMLDIIFILLVNFMTASIFAQWENKLEITVPSAQSGVPGARQTGELIINIDADGKVFINSKLISDEMLLKLMTQISSAYKTQPVILRADKKTDCQQLIRVLDICRQADIWNIAFATVSPDDAEATGK